MKFAWILAAGLAATAAGALAQTTDSTTPTPVAPTTMAPAVASSSADAAAAIPGTLQLANGTVVEIEIAEPLSSRSNKRGDKFQLTLAAPVVSNGQLVLPAGTSGTGEIVHADRSRGGGKPGELLLAARYLDLAGQRIPLRGFKLGAAGKDNTALALGTSFALGPFAHFIHGQEIEIPAGTKANAKLAADVALPAAPSPAPPTEPLSPSPTQE